mmetsp:Transcript_8553/g.21719  ORF Transcript_8553/g.21719 Transcript_8553/m.21719 type:complete len:261 (+) Transcript_8553:392-1174(+)
MLRSKHRLVLPLLRFGGAHRVLHEGGCGDRANPAGDRRDPAHNGQARFHVGIANDRVLAGLRVLDRVDANVDERRARLEHVAADQVRLANRDEHRVGFTGMQGEVARHVVARRHDGTLVHEEKRDGLADDLRVAHHNAAEAAKRAVGPSGESGGLEASHGGFGGAGHELGLAVHDVADRARVHALDVFERVNGHLDIVRREVAREGALHDHAGDAWVLVGVLEHAHEALGGYVVGHAALLELYAALLRHATLVAHVPRDG